MKELSLKDVDLREKDSEIIRLKVEIDEMLVRAREEYKKEIKVLLVCVLCCVFKVYFIVGLREHTWNTPRRV